MKKLKNCDELRKISQLLLKEESQARMNEIISQMISRFPFSKEMSEYQMTFKLLRVIYDRDKLKVKRYF